MAAGIYTQANLTDALNGRTHQKNSLLASAQTLVNQAVREVLGRVDLRGSKRESALAPNLFDNIYDYVAPADLKGQGVIDLILQTGRSMNDDWSLVTPEYFDRRKKVENNLIAISDDELVRKLRISANVDDETQVIGNLNTVTGDGDTWAGFGGVTDSNVKTDADNFIEGSGAVTFMNDTVVTDTNVGIQNKGLATMSIAGLTNGTAIFTGRLTLRDNNIKNAYVRIGSDTSNYYQASDSTTEEGNPFQTGWNLVSFDMTSKVTTGTPVDTAIKYAAMFWAKDSATHNTDTDNAFDYLILKKGKFANLVYYSKYLWQTTATAAYKENSSATTDTLSIDTEELELIILRAWMLASQELRDYVDYKIAKQEYEEAEAKYKMRYQSEALVLSMPYHYFDSLEATITDRDS